MLRSIMPVMLIVALLTGTVFAQERGISLGIILGEPTGLSGKWMMSSRTAVNGAAAWSLGQKDALHLHADYVFHNFAVFRDDVDNLSLYYGIGGRLLLADKDNFFGARFPVGVEYTFSEIPLNAFFEFAPLLDLLPKTDFDLNAAVGVRYFLGQKPGQHFFK